MNRTHATTHRDVADEDVARLPFLIETLKPEPKPRGARQGKDYMATHDRIRFLFGKAEEHRCIDCFGEAKDWSIQSYEDAILDRITNCWYSPDVTRYVPRCRVCHRRHDQKLRETASKVS